MPLTRRRTVALLATAVVVAFLAGIVTGIALERHRSATEPGAGPATSAVEPTSPPGLTTEPSPPPGAPPTVPAQAVTDETDGYLWKPVRIGGGGNISGIGAANDGTLVARSDVYGAYIRRAGTGEWRQLLTVDSVPAEFHLPKMGKGVQEVAVAPSDSNHVYVMWAGHLLASSDGGATFAVTAFGPTPWDANGPFGRGFGDKMAVAPDDPNLVLAAGPATALRRSTDGGATWADTTVPAGAAEPKLSADTGGEIPSVGITGIAFDPNRPGVVFAASWGNGVYRSTDGGETWSAIGGPTAVEHAAIDAGGAYYALDGDRDGPFTVQRYDAATWKAITPSEWRPGSIADVENPFLAASPTDPGIVVIGYAGQMFASRDGGAAWSALDWSDTDGDLPWLRTDGEDYYLVASDLIFDPSTPNRLILATGTGVRVAQLGDSDTLQWGSATRGMETMVATGSASTRNGPPIFGVFDFGQFGGSADLDGFALLKGPTGDFAGTTSLAASPFADGFAVSATTSYIGDKPPNYSGWTDDGGATWHRFGSLPAGAKDGSGFGYGAIAVGEPDNIVWAPGRFYATTQSSFQPYYTTDRGETWKPVELPGVSTYPPDTIGGFMFGRNYQTVTADPVAPGTFYISMIGEGLFRTTDRGATWERIHDGAFSYGDPTAGALLEAMPGASGQLFFTDGSGGGHDYEGAQDYAGSPFIRSRDGGAIWEPVAGVDKVLTFGFGAPAPGQSAAAIYLAGAVNGDYGIWRSIDDGTSWHRIAEYPLTVDWVSSISGDVNTFGTVYIGFAGSSYAYGVPVD